MHTFGWCEGPSGLHRLLQAALPRGTGQALRHETVVVGALDLIGVKGREERGVPRREFLQRAPPSKPLQAAQKGLHRLPEETVHDSETIQPTQPGEIHTTRKEQCEQGDVEQRLHVSTSAATTVNHVVVDGRRLPARTTPRSSTVDSHTAGSPLYVTTVTGMRTSHTGTPLSAIHLKASGPGTKGRSA